jgi:hypothetical protein
MHRVSSVALAAALLASLPAAARAGWIVEWQNTSVKSTGERMDTQPATMYLSGGHVRFEQPHTTSVIDYDKGRLTILNTDRQYFWSGSVDEYVNEMTKNRAKALRERIGKDTDSKFAMPKVNLDHLPAISIKKTGEKKTVAGYETWKYEISSNGEPFQEIWIAENLDLSKDLDPKKFLDYQRKVSRAMLGQAAGRYNALYRSEDYAKLLEKGYALETNVHHIAGGYERKATALRQADVPASKFDVPDDYRRVRLSDVFPSDDKG